MKSTYKLLGAFWDGLPEARPSIEVVPHNENIAETGVGQLSIYDYPEISRFVSIKKIFSMGNLELVEHYVQKAKFAQSIYVMLDYRPETKSTILAEFYQHRVSQLCWYMRKICPSSNIKLMEAPTSSLPKNIGTANCLLDFFRIVELYSHYVNKHGIELEDSGLPIFRESMLLTEWPNELLTFKKRQEHYPGAASNAAICYFTDDKANYRRIRFMDKDIEELKGFGGICGMDVTVTHDMDIEWQRCTMLLNLLYTAAVAANHIKVAFNIRSGLPQTWDCFATIPPGATVALGTLGCSRIKTDYDLECISKIAMLRPSKILIYGRSDPILEKQIMRMGMSFRRFEDVRTIGFAKSKGKCRKQHDNPHASRPLFEGK